MKKAKQDTAEEEKITKDLSKLTKKEKLQVSVFYFPIMDANVCLSVIFRIIYSIYIYSI